MERQAQACGQRTVLWDVSAVDWGPLGVASQIEQRLQAVQSGAVVLMHDGRNRHNRPDQLLEALPRLLEGWRQRGLQSVGLTLNVC